MKDAKGQVTTYTYDKANRLKETQFADATKHTFSYDDVGNMTGYASPVATGTLVYDAANRKTSETVNFGTFSKGYSYTYDERGNKKTFTTPEGTTYNYTYNRNNQPTQIDTPVGPITMTYEWVRQKKLTYPNGIVTDYAYNDANWLSQIMATKANAAPPTMVSNAVYAFDNVGNITGKTTEATVHSYGYDDLYQQTRATIPTLPQEVYTYDKVGNRKTSAATQGTWSYNNNNELQGYVGVSLSYDANGNTIGKTDSSRAVTYNYDATDRLTTVQVSNGLTASYAYDPFGRRMKKQVGDEVTYYLYSDEGLIGEYGLDGAFKKGYSWKPNGIWGTDPITMVENAKYNFYHNDQLGTPQKLTDQAGNVVWSAAYNAFGEATVDSSSTVVNNLRFPGQYFDEETRLHYNWQRYYDVATGRYTQVDPLRFGSGDENLFRYVKNGPTNFSDAFGLLNERLLAGSLVGIASNTVGVVAGGLALGAPTGVTQVLGFVVLTKSTAGLALNVNNLLKSIYGGKELPSSLATYIAFKVAPCNKKAQIKAAALDLIVDLLFSMGARAGVAVAEKAALKASLESANLTFQQVKYANPAELGTAADTFYILSLGDAVLSAHGH